MVICPPSPEKFRIFDLAYLQGLLTYEAQNLVFGFFFVLRIPSLYKTEIKFLSQKGLEICNVKNPNPLSGRHITTAPGTKPPIRYVVTCLKGWGSEFTTGITGWWSGFPSGWGSEFWVHMYTHFILKFTYM